MQRNQAQFLKSAQNISRWGATAEGEAGAPVSLEKEIVGTITSQRGYEANLAVVRAADEMLGSLLDTFA